MRIRRRARRLQLPQGDIDDHVRRWLDRGGILAIVGKERSGKSQLLDRIARRLVARNTPTLRLFAWTLPWAAVKQALRDPHLPGPPGALVQMGDRTLQARSAASDLAHRANGRLRILVDDVESLDPGTSKVLASLATRDDVDIAAMGTRAPSWAQAPVELGPVDSVEDFLDAVLRDVDVASSLAGRVKATTGGYPGRILDWLDAATSASALTARGSSWTVQDDMLPTDDRPPSLPTGAMRVGSVLSAYRSPFLTSALPAVTSMTEASINRALELLMLRNLARVARDKAFVSGPRANLLFASQPADPDLLDAVLRYELDQKDPDAVRLGWLVIGAGRDDIAAKLGGKIAHAAIDRDPVYGAQLAESLAHLSSSADIVAAQVRALREIGRGKQAFALGRAHLSNREWRSSDTQVLLELAYLYEQHNDTASALRCVDLARRACGPMVPPIQLPLVEARLLLASGRTRDAIACAAPTARTTPPAEPADHEGWLQLHLVLIEAMERVGAADDALEILDQIDDVHLQGSLGARLRGHAARLRALAGEPEEGAADLEAIAKDPRLTPTDRADLAHQSARLRLQIGDVVPALHSLASAAEVLGELGATGSEARIQLDMSRAFARLRSWDRAARASARALELAIDARDANLGAQAAAELAHVHLARGAFNEAVEAIQHAARSADPQVQAKVALVRAQAAVLSRATDAEERCVLASAQAGVAGALGIRGIADAMAMAAQTGRLPAPADLHESLDDLVSDCTAEEAATAKLWMARGLHSSRRYDEAQQLCQAVVSYAVEYDDLNLREAAKTLLDRMPGRSRSSASRSIVHVIEETLKVNHHHDIKAVMNVVAAGCLELLQVDRVQAILIDNRGVPRIRASRSATNATRSRIPRVVVDRVLKRARPLLAPRVADRADLRNQPEVIDAGSGALFCVPLMTHGRVVGALYADCREPRPAGGNERETMEMLASLAAASFAASELLDTRDQFAQDRMSAASGLREPIGTILVATSALRAHATGNPQMADTLDEINQAARTLLDLAKQVQGQGKASHGALDLVEITVRGVASLTLEARARGVDIELDLAPEAWVVGSAVHLGRVLASLVSHAVSHSRPSDSVEICLGTTPQTVAWTVRNRGSAVPEGENGAFQRLEPGDTSPASTRAGLAAVRTAVEAHGGTLVTGHRDGGGEVIKAEFPRVSRPA